MHVYYNIIPSIGFTAWARIFLGLVIAVSLLGWRRGASWRIAGIVGAVVLALAGLKVLLNPVVDPGDAGIFRNAGRAVWRGKTRTGR
jgi:hypothetical protein